MYRYFLRFAMVDGRVVDSDVYVTDDLTCAHIMFKSNRPRFFRDVRSTSLVSRVSGRVLKKESL